MPCFFRIVYGSSPRATSPSRVLLSDRSCWSAALIEANIIIGAGDDGRAACASVLDITTHLAQHALIDDSVASMPGFTGCQAGSGQGCITANGTVLPCVLLPVALGNIRERRFLDIWLNSALNRQFQSRDCLEGECGGCRVREQCGGCRAVAYAVTANPLAADPRCWLVNEAQNNANLRELKMVNYG